MISAYAQVLIGLAAFCSCVWGYVQGMKLSIANKRRGLNGSSGMTARTIKRREVIHGMKCLVVVGTGIYLVVWLNREEPADRYVVALRSVGFSIIAFLIGLNTMWDALDRLNLIEAKDAEDAKLHLQKRQTDPTPGAILPPEELERVNPPQQVSGNA